MNQYKKTHSDGMAKDVSKNEMIILTARDWNAFIKALDSPDKPKPKLSTAIEQYREWKRRVLMEARQK